MSLGLTTAILTVPLFEGKRNEVYKDPVGIATVCYGHTGPEVRYGDTYTDAQCQQYLYEDILVAWETVERCAPGVPLSPMTRSALTSFTLNVGPGGKGVKDGFCRLKSGREPTMLRKLKAGDIEGACRELPKWNAQKLPGITKRRAHEEEMCLNGLQ